MARRQHIAMTRVLFAVSPVASLSSLALGGDDAVPAPAPVAAGGPGSDPVVVR